MTDETVSGGPPFWFWPVVAMCAVVSAATLLSSCGPKPGPKPPVAPVIKVERIRVFCLEAKPPQSEPVRFIGPEGGCPDAFAGCLDLDGARGLLRYINALQDYTKSAWTLCGNAPLKEEEEHD